MRIAIPHKVDSPMGQGHYGMVETGQTASTKTHKLTYIHTHAYTHSHTYTYSCSEYTLHAEPTNIYTHPRGPVQTLRQIHIHSWAHIQSTHTTHSSHSRQHTAPCPTPGHSCSHTATQAHVHAPRYTPTHIAMTAPSLFIARCIFLKILTLFID